MQVSVSTVSGLERRLEVAVPADRVAQTTALLNGRVSVVEGGPERCDTVRLALEAAGDPEFILVHDAAAWRAKRL